MWVAPDSEVVSPPAKAATETRLSKLTDPSDALASIQKTIDSGIPFLQPGILDSTIFVHAVSLNGAPCFTYVRMDKKIITALVAFAASEPLEGRPCFSVGYVVPEKYRNQGRAKAIVKSAIAEMDYMLSQAGLGPCFVEAIVGSDNGPAQSVAAQTISANGAVGKDGVGRSAFQYVRTIGSVARA